MRKAPVARRLAGCAAPGGAARLQGMSRTIEAVYEDGVLKPLEPLRLPEHARTRVTVEEEPGQTLADFPEYTGPLPRKFLSSGVFDSGRSDVSERAEELLAEGFGHDDK